MDGRYEDARAGRSFEIKSITEDATGGFVMAFAVFTGSHTGPGGPIKPTGKAVKTDYLFVMQMDDGKVGRVTKVWNDVNALPQLAWL